MIKVIIIIVVLLACVVAYMMHLALKKYVDPTRSFSHLLFYFLAHSTGVFMILFLLNYLLLKYGRVLFHS